MYEDAFIRAMVANPDDDMIRLVYADWLDEQGRSERAEFIRLQIELTRVIDDSRRAVLQARESELLRTYERSWVPSDPLAFHCTWKRGFITGLRPTVAGVFQGEDTLKILALFPLVEELKFGFCMWDDEFQHIPNLPCLRLLEIGGNVGITETSIRRIGGWQTLCSLGLSIDALTDASLPHLAGLINLRELDLSYSGITDVGLSHLLAFSALESLDISSTVITGRGLAVLSNLPRLTKLILTDMWERDFGIGGLAGCRSLEEIRLDLMDWANPPVLTATFAVLQQLPRLRILDIATP